ncbi:NAD(P)-dependent oxidoreductase [Croceivirga radicis]|uniref:NAD(P)-dependent oxidoreductase n=1 Tax=Croceivirga radicis TaxID=1929488 RepID=A0A1V6LV32_9FLAO|nr:NAD-dependent epimerase/dehydratase family protein [Croceivirga radicis]OQD43999.1 NAD(P)-dependent oxidoreductase [Croceivirga radicis]
MSKTIGILGCGWLGTPLAENLLERKFQVLGTTTQSNKLPLLTAKGIKAFELYVAEDKISGDLNTFLTNLTVLIVNIPPKLRGPNPQNFTAKMQLLLKAIGTLKLKVIFVSSTSVYGNVDGEVTEDTPPNPVTESGKQLLKAENLFRNTPNLETTVVRFGGLIGPDRHPINHLSGKRDLTNGDEIINLIHIKDCIRMITLILENNWWNITINGACPYHPTKKEYYTQEALKRGLQIPVYSQNSSKIYQKFIKSRNFPYYNEGFYTTIQ